MRHISKNWPLALMNKRLLAIILGALSFGLGVSAPAQTTPQTAPRVTVPSSQLPSLGDGSEMTIGDERRMGDRIAREIFRDPDYIDDPILTDYVDGIWQPLLAAARIRGELPPELDQRFAWRIMMGRDRTVNAFALPGGYFGLHLGLVGIVTSRDELASVLGHELSHVTQRHISRLISKQNAQSPWMIAGMILGILAASKSADAGSAVLAGSQAVAIQNQLNFSRDMEREADRVGFGVMTQAGFEPLGFVTMFDKLQQSSRLNDNGAYPYLRSHPLTTERIADMQARVSLLPAAPTAVMSMEHAMVSARARALSNPGVDALRAMVADGKRLTSPSAPRRAAVLYAAILAALQLRDVDVAKAYLVSLAELTADDAPATRLTRMADTELALATNDAARAVQVMRTLPKSVAAAQGATQNRAEVMLLARAQIRTGQASDAAQALQLWLGSHGVDASAWQLLGTAYAAQGQTLRAIRAEAEAQVAVLDFGAAMDRFKAAQELVQRPPAGMVVDHIEASIIDTRARQVALLLREQAAER
jgi:predicted Zn-dependent protease